MNPLTLRIERLKRRSQSVAPEVCGERARLVTEFYRSGELSSSSAINRASMFAYLLSEKEVHIHEDELIVGDRAALPKSASTYPEISCHTLEDLRLLKSREKMRYGVSEEVMASYRDDIIPFWKGKSLRERAFDAMAPKWRDVYEAGVFTEFLEQRAPGHTVADGKIYRRGFLDFKKAIEKRIIALEGDADAHARQDQLRAMGIACDAIIAFARRYAQKALAMADEEPNPTRRKELMRIAETCSFVPARAPRTFYEAIQMYWFTHLGVICELNGWDAFSPGHLDQHLVKFYRKDIKNGTLDRQSALTMIECLWIKFNDQPAPPKVGVTAAESGTYNDFVNINLGGLLGGGQDGVSEVSELILEVVDSLPLLQPGTNIQVSQVTDQKFLEQACRVIKKGHGFPSLFNADGIVAQMRRVGKNLKDARGGGASGCVETGCFGKEAYILTGYMNLPKIFEVALHNGADPVTGKQIGVKTGKKKSLQSMDSLMGAFKAQLAHFVDIKVGGNDVFERLYAEEIPAPFLSVVIDDCIENGVDYNAGGARYNTRYIQGVGIGTITDSLHAIEQRVFESAESSMDGLIEALDSDFSEDPLLRERLLNTPGRYGNDNDAADALMKKVVDLFRTEVEARKGELGGSYHIAMLPTTCHIYFGSKCIATADGRRAGKPLSEGISPVQGMDRIGPTAVLKSASKMDQRRTGGTLLNLKLTPDVLAGPEGERRLAQLVRAYFKLGGHHVQFNVVDVETLRRAQKDPAHHRDLLVRVAGYSDYFCDLSEDLQDEIISRTAHG